MALCTDDDATAKHRNDDVQALLSHEEKRQDVLMHVLDLGIRAAPDAKALPAVQHLHDKIPKRNAPHDQDHHAPEQHAMPPAAPRPGVDMRHGGDLGCSFAHGPVEQHSAIQCRDSSMDTLFAPAKFGAVVGQSMEDIICHCVRQVCCSPVLFRYVTE